MARRKNAWLRVRIPRSPPINTLQIEEINYYSEEYLKLLNFRFLNLRKPLNLEWSKEDLLNENQQNHFALKNQSNIIGSFCLKKIDCTTIRLRQMAIEKKYQKQGYGLSLIHI